MTEEENGEKPNISDRALKIILVCCVAVVCGLFGYALLGSHNYEITYSEEVITDKYFSSGEWHIRTNNSLISIDENRYHQLSLGETIIICNQNYLTPGYDSMDEKRFYGRP